MTTLQNYNRYSYVLNNPASFNDPSGHFWQAIVGAILSVIPGVNWLGAALIMAGLTAAQTIATGGSFADAFKAAAITFAMAGVAAGVGSMFGETASLLKSFSWENLGTELARASAHGMSGGFFAEVGGGDFTAGFAAGFAGSMGGSVVGDGLFGTNGDGDFKNMTLRTASAAIIGGTAAELGGGKFANGAATAGIQHLFNAESIHEDQTSDGKAGINWVKGEGATDEDLALAKDQWASAKNIVDENGNPAMHVAYMEQVEKGVGGNQNSVVVYGKDVAFQQSVVADYDGAPLDGMRLTATIRYRPQDFGIYDVDGTFWNGSTVLVHEAVHVARFNLGSWKSNKYLEEVSATMIENQYRKHAGYAQRKMYGSWDIPQH